MTFFIHQSLTHIEDHRTGRRWCMPDQRAEGELTRRENFSNCDECLKSYSAYRRITACAAVGGLRVDPKTAERLFRWGDDSARLRERLAEKGIGS